MDQEESELWHRLKSKGDQDARNLLIEKYLDLVHRAAERMFFSLNAKVEKDELFSAGILGLMDAVQKYIPSPHVKFSTYSTQRIKGAMLDDIRSKDWVPRLCRQAYNTYHKAFQELSQELQRPPKDEEIMGFLDISPEEFHKLCKEMNITTMSSIQLLSQSREDDGGDDDWLADQRQDQNLKQKDQKIFLRKIIEELPEKKKSVLIMYYFEEMTLKEISKVLEITEGRVSQILSTVLAQLNSRYNKEKEVYL